MWFGLYSRNNNKMDSSGFEHIFAGLDRGDMFETPQMFCKYVFLTFLTFCNRRSQGRKGVWFPQLDPVLSSWEKRTAELLQPQLQRARKRQQLRPQYVGFCCYMCSSAFSFFLSFFPALSGLPTLMSWGCSSCGMATSSRSGPQSLAAALNLTLPFTASATSVALENSE